MDNNGYLIMDYSEYDWSPNSEDRNIIFRVAHTDEELLQHIDGARKHDIKISVYKIGECLLDWS